LEYKMKTLRIVLIITILAIGLNSCSRDNTAGQSDLGDATWILTSYNENRPIEGTQTTLQFKEGQISGNAGCNHYGGSYQIKGDALSFADLFNTEIACIEPEGVMKQEQIYLELLGASQRFELVDGVLTLFTSQQQTLTFGNPQDSLLLPTPTLEQPNPIPLTPTVEILESTPTPAFEPPVGFKEYQDSVVGISLYIPESWLVTSIIEGQSAIFQSYPAEKYVGGEMLEPGDTKCDLNIRLPGARVADLIQQWKSDSFITIISERDIVLQSGQPGIRMEMDSMGRSISVITQINERVVVLTCFGDFTRFDEIAGTIKASE